MTIFMGGGISGGPIIPPIPSPNPPVQQPPFYISTTALPAGIPGQQYQASVEAVGGTKPYSFAITGGALPAGLAMSAGGVITGVPTAAGSFTFIVKATDSSDPALTATATFTVVIVTLPSILTSALPNGTVGVAYNGDIVAQGANPPFTFAVSAGALPPGLALADQGGITGIPTAQGVFQFAVTVTDSGDPAETSTTLFTITIVAAQVAATVPAADTELLIAGEDGGIYCVEEGQYHDDDVDGEPHGYLSQWTGVAPANPGLSVMQLGGMTVSGKGSGVLNVSVVDDTGKSYPLTTPQRQFIFAEDADGNPIETKRDVVARAVPHLERFGPSFDNGGVADAWFEIHSAIQWQRKFFAARRG